MRRSAEKADRKARLRRKLETDLYRVLGAYLDSEEPDEQGIAVAIQLQALIFNTCDAIRAIDNGHPEKARRHLMHSLLLVATCGDDRREATKEGRALWNDILEGRRNIAEIMPSPPDPGPRIFDGTA